MTNFDRVFKINLYRIHVRISHFGKKMYIFVGLPESEGYIESDVNL